MWKLKLNPSSEKSQWKDRLFKFQTFFLRFCFSNSKNGTSCKQRCLKLHCYSCPLLFHWWQYISQADHWICRLSGEEIWSVMKPPIDFVLPSCRCWHQADGNFPPCSHWLSVILFQDSGHTRHLFSVSLGWHLGIWDTFVETWKEKKTTCIEPNVVPVINARGLFCRDNAESRLKCANSH